MNRYRTTLFCVFLLLAAGPSAGEDPAQHDGKLLSGMSIVGNDEAPKSLVIVPWKSSELGASSFPTIDCNRSTGRSFRGSSTTTQSG